MIFANIMIALRMIAANKLRTALTMLGLVIGISSVVTINAIGEGVKQSVTSQVDALGTNLIQINPGGGEGFAAFTASLGTSTLSERDVADVKNVNGVEAAAPVMIVSGAPSKDTKLASGAIMFGTTSDYAKAVKTELEVGEFALDTSENSVVLGSKVAEEIFGRLNVVGETIKIRGEEFKVVGVTKKPAEGGLSLGPSVDSIVYIPFEVSKRLNNGNTNINEVEVKVANATEVGQVKSDIRDTIRKNHGGELDFSLSDAKEQLKVFDQILGLITTFVAAIASIGLLVGGIGIMNIMLVSVTERTREIGLRKALGATRWTILMQFLIEAVVLCLLGGVFGVALAYVGAFGIGAFADITPVVTWAMIAYAATTSIVIGIIFGTAPAIKAARMKPIDALRYE